DRCGSETCLGGSTSGAAHAQKSDQVTLHTGATFDDEHALVVPSQGLGATLARRNPRATAGTNGALSYVTAVAPQKLEECRESTSRHRNRGCRQWVTRDPL